MLYAKEIGIRVNSEVLKEFNATCEYLHKVHRKNCYYDKSAPFKFIIRTFNEIFESKPINYWNNELEKYNSRVEKDKKVSFWLSEYYYIQYLNNCERLGISRSKATRSLMLKLIQETKIE